MRALEDRERRAIRIGLLILLPVLVGRCAVEPYFGALGRDRSRLSEERSLLAREMALVVARKAMKGLADTTAMAFAIRSVRLFQSDPTLAANALVSYVADLASSNWMLVQTADAQGVEELGRGPVRAVHAHIQAVGDIGEVLNLLRALELGQKLVRVDRLTLKRQASSGAVVAPDSVRLISLDAIVTGYTLPPDLYAAEGWR